jgi:hypothetical protein
MMSKNQGLAGILGFSGKGGHHHAFNGMRKITTAMRTNVTDNVWSVTESMTARIC